MQDEPRREGVTIAAECGVRRTECGERRSAACGELPATAQYSNDRPTGGIVTGTPEPEAAMANAPARGTSAERVGATGRSRQGARARGLAALGATMISDAASVAAHTAALMSGLRASSVSGRRSDWGTERSVTA